MKKGIALGLLVSFLMGMTLDKVAGGSVPSAAGDVLCGTAANAASFSQPGSCWGTTLQLNPSGSSTSTPGILGWTTWSSGQASVFGFGDTGNRIQSAYGDRIQLVAYHGIKVVGATGSTTPPAFEVGSGTSDASLTVVGNGTSDALDVQGAIKLGSSGTAISGSFRGTTTNPGAVSAQSFLDVSVTVTGAATGAECAVGLPAAYSSAIAPSCFVSASNTVKLHLVNPTTGSLTPTAGTYSVRVFNP